jgi:YHS domain-containing protein
MTSRPISTILGMAAVLAMALSASPQDKKPVNAKCPVKAGMAANAGITSDFEGKTVGFCCNNCKAAFDGDPKAFAAKIPELKAPAKPAAKAPAGPVNQSCPVNGEGVDPKYSIVVQGKVIAFCSRICNNKFVSNMATYLPNVPGFEKKAPEKKAEEKKPDGKPVVYGPCECKKTAKGYYCLECKRELSMDDVRGNLCKRCETKPAPIEYCVRFGAPYLHPGEKAPRPDEDRARVSYACESCDSKGELESEFKHKPDCKPSFGSGVKKVCAKSGTAPHLGDPK